MGFGSTHIEKLLIPIYNILENSCFRLVLIVEIGISFPVPSFPLSLKFTHHRMQSGRTVGFPWGSTVCCKYLHWSPMQISVVAGGISPPPSLIDVPSFRDG